MKSLIDINLHDHASGFDDFLPFFCVFRFFVVMAFFLLARGFLRKHDQGYPPLSAIKKQVTVAYI
ncbi:hypothetical protein [Vibrio aphrogenes]|uniref:hypothetical protein n=1 Tax=Vibrio aphrogenes TaxID=1891186 RepID=UPI000B356259|nr:hypothetical protein [Vibrio aphrogenes]